jgi:hypothetical protein
MSSLATLVMLVALAPAAEAVCITPTRPAIAAQRLPAGSLARPSEGIRDESERSIVGFWQTTFYIGATTDIWDQAFELWHADGTEVALDNAVPPILGNVCLGTWKQVGRTIHLLHYAWNWNPDGTKAGIFKLEATVTVGQNGRTFSGNYISDSFDTDGKIINELHAEGTIRGTRITVD